MSTNNEELELFRDMVLRFFEQEVAPNYEQWEADHIIPKEFWRTLGEAGLLLVDMPEQYGTAGASYEVTQMILHEMTRLGYYGLSTGYSIHANIVAPYINNIATEEQKAQWLPKMATGEVIGAFFKRSLFNVGTILVAFSFFSRPRTLTLLLLVFAVLPTMADIFFLNRRSSVVFLALTIGAAAMFARC